MTAPSASRISVAGIAVMVILTGIFLAGPVWMLVRHTRQADAAQAHLQAKKDELAQAQRTLAGVNRQLNSLEAKLSASPIHLQPASAINTRLGELSDLATDCGLLIDEIKPGSAALGEHYKIVSVYLAGVGTYQQCAVFCRRLREALPDMGAHSFTLAADITKRGQPATFGFDLRWYAAKQDLAEK